MRVICRPGVLLPPLIRAIDWVPVGAAAVVSLGLALVTTPGSAVEPANAMVTLRMAGVLLGAAAGFALVDAAAVTTAVAPVPRWLRQWIRTLLVAGAAAAAWAGTLLLLMVRLADGTEMRTPGLVTEAAVSLLIGLACTAVAVRQRPERIAAVIGAAALLVIAVSTLPYVEDVWPYPASPRWGEIHRAWLWVLPTPLLTLALAHRDVGR
ncbi:hypothetical protein ACH4GP_28575 [Streptomyces celluloflavus]|uniref:ABC transporter n=1 Tax=Streptomyces celluloflavus TaxID=58344 RepID=A0ABW7RJQ7_9ACTN